MYGRLLRCLTGLAVLLALVATPAHAGEGFGASKKIAKLVRVNPPQVNITGVRIAVRASSQGGRHEPLAQRLQSQLESQLVGNDSKLTIDTKEPDTIVDLSVLQSDYSESWENREGTQQVAAGKDKNGKQQYNTQRVTLKFKIVKHTFSVAFKVNDVKSNRSLVGDTINQNYRQEFQDGNGAPNATALEDGDVSTVVRDLKHRLTSTKENVSVLLPKGRLEAAAAFAEAGLWSKYLDALEKLPPLADAADEAYHQYALGVAYEALGYGADDVDTTLKYLEQASVHYNTAVESKPKEDYFLKPFKSFWDKSATADAPIARIQSAVLQYQKLKEFSAASARASSAATTVGSKGELGSPDGAMTNASVVEMLRAGLPEDVIITSISSAPSTAFDVSPKGLIQLQQAKASKKLIQQIQTSASGGKLPKADQPKPSRPKKASAASGGGQ